MFISLCIRNTKTINDLLHWTFNFISLRELHLQFGSTKTVGAATSPTAVEHRKFSNEIENATNELLIKHSADDMKFCIVLVS